MALHMNGKQPHDPEALFAYTLERAQHLRHFTSTAREAAENAVLMAHNRVNRWAFVSYLEALGGLEAVLQRLTAALEGSEKG